MSKIWAYRFGGSAKHVLVSTKKTRSVCGRAPKLYWQSWKTDPEGLAKLEKCKRCVFLLTPK